MGSARTTGVGRGWRTGVPPWLVVLIATVGCGGSPAEPEVFEPPARYAVTGQAVGANDGFAVSCTMDLVFEWDGLERLETARVYVTSGGGEVERAIERPDGTALVFTPFLFSQENHVRLLGADGVALETPVNLGTGIPFYEGIGRMTGRITGPGTAEGTWTCGALSIDEDGAGPAEGTWRLEPA